MEKISFTLEKLTEKKIFFKKIVRPKISRKNMFLDKIWIFFQIVLKILIYSDKVSGQNVFLEKLFKKFPEIFLEKEKELFSLKKFPNKINFWTSFQTLSVSGQILKNFQIF